MSFRLLIECTKDINDIHINFADGTSTISEESKHIDVPDTPNESNESNESTKTKKTRNIKKESGRQFKQEPQHKSKRQDNMLDLDADFEHHEVDIVKLPVINENIRPINVAEELQNLDI